MEPEEAETDVPSSSTPDNPEDITPLFTPPQTRVPTPIPGPVTQTTYTSSYDSKVYETKKASQWYIIVIGGNRNTEFVVKKVETVPSFQYVPRPIPRELAVVAVSDQDDSVHVFRTSALAPENEYADRLETLELEKDTISLDVYEKKRHNLEVAYQKQKATTDALQFIEGEPIADKLPPAKYGWQMWENGRFEVVDRESDTFEGILYDAPLVIGLEKIVGFDQSQLDAPLLIRQKLVITRTNEFPAMVQNYGTELVFTPAFGKGEWKLMVPETEPPVVIQPEIIEESESEEEEETIELSDTEIEERAREVARKKEAERKRQEEEAKLKEKEKANAPKQKRFPIYLDNAGELGATPNDTEQILDNIAERLQNTFPNLIGAVFRRLFIPERVPTLTTSPTAYAKEFAGIYSDWRKNGLDAVLTNEQIGFYADKYILVVTPTLESKTPNLEENLRRIKAAHTLPLFKDERIVQATVALSALRPIQTGAEYKRTERIEELTTKFRTFFEVVKDTKYRQDLPKVVVSKQVTLTIGAKRSGSAWKPEDYSTNSTIRASMRADEEFVYVFADSRNKLHQVTLWISVRKPCIRCKGNYTDGENRHGACRWHSAHPQHFARQHERELRTLRDYLFDHWQKLGLKSSWPAESTFRELYDLCPNSKMFSRIKQKMDELECRDPDLIAQSRTERPLGLMNTRLCDLEELMYSSNSNSRVNSEDVRVRECSRLYSRLLTQRSVEKCLRGVDFDPRDPVTVPERLIFGEPKQAELTHWQRALENRYERDANGKAVAAPRRDQFGRTVSPHWHHGQVRVAGGLVYACCGQQEPCYTGRHSMDDVQPDLQIQDVTGLKQRGSDHVLLDKTTEQLTREVKEAHANAEHGKALMLLDEFNHCHGGIRIPGNVKFTHDVDKAYRRYLRNPTQQNRDDFWGTVGRNGLGGDNWWYRSRFEQLEYNRNFTPLHVDTAQIDANILKLAAESMIFQRDPSRFVYQKPKKPEECRPVKRTPTPSAPPSSTVPYRKVPTQLPPVKKTGPRASFLEQFDNWYKENLQRFSERQAYYIEFRNWVTKTKYWLPTDDFTKNTLLGEIENAIVGLAEQKEKFTKYRNDIMAQSTFEKFEEAVALHNNGFVSIAYGIELLTKYVFENVFTYANHIQTGFKMATTDPSLFYKPDPKYATSPERTEFADLELEHLQKKFPNARIYPLAPDVMYKDGKAELKFKGLLEVPDWKATIKAFERYPRLTLVIVGLYDVPEDFRQDVLQYQTENPGRLFVFTKTGETETGYGENEFRRALQDAENKLDKAPERPPFEFSPLPDFTDQPPPSSKPPPASTKPPPSSMAKDDPRMIKFVKQFELFHKSVLQNLANSLDFIKKARKWIDTVSTDFWQRHKDEFSFAEAADAVSSSPSKLESARSTLETDAYGVRWSAESEVFDFNESMPRLATKYKVYMDDLIAVHRSMKDANDLFETIQKQATADGLEVPTEKEEEFVNPPDSPDPAFEDWWQPPPPETDIESPPVPGTESPPSSPQSMRKPRPEPTPSATEPEETGLTVTTRKKDLLELIDSFKKLERKNSTKLYSIRTWLDSLTAWRERYLPSIQNRLSNVAEFKQYHTKVKAAYADQIFEIENSVKVVLQNEIKAQRTTDPEKITKLFNKTKPLVQAYIRHLNILVNQSDLSNLLDLTADWNKKFATRALSKEDAARYFPAQPILGSGFKLTLPLLVVENAYLSTFQSTMKKLRSPLPNIRLDITTSRQKVDFSAFV